jgi:hypothetical protein
MKKFLVLFFIVCLIACAFAQDHDGHEAEGPGPISITKNNIGSITKVNVDASAVISSNIEANIVQALLAALNQQAAVAAN